MLTFTSSFVPVMVPPCVVLSTHLPESVEPVCASVTVRLLLRAAEYPCQVPLMFSPEGVTGEEPHAETPSATTTTARRVRISHPAFGEIRGWTSIETAGLACLDRAGSDRVVRQ